jgi:RNase P subunit RPR2
MTGKGKRAEQEHAGREIERLFTLAAEAGAAEQKLADRYVHLACELSRRNRVSLRKYNRVHCRKCSTFFTSKTLRVRTRAGVGIVYACLRCGDITRIPTTVKVKTVRTPITKKPFDKERSEKGKPAENRKSGIDAREKSGQPTVRS